MRHEEDFSSRVSSRASVVRVPACSSEQKNSFSNGGEGHG